MKSFLSGKPSLTTPALTSSVPRPALGQPPTLASGARSHAAHAPTVTGHGSSGPQIDLIKEGGKVVRLVITCPCGERVEVECLYPAGI